jgi:hypothetical protein
VLFSIRDQGGAVDVTTPPLVVGSSLATMRVDSDIIATWSLVGDSSTPEGALAVSITAGPSNAGIAAPAAPVDAPADQVVAPTPVVTPEEHAAAQPTFSFQENADNRGRLRVQLTAPAGCTVQSDANNISCRTRGNGDTRCRGRNLQPNQQVTFTCQ